MAHFDPRRSIAGLLLLAAPVATALPSPAMADCAPFQTLGSGATLFGEARCEPGTFQTTQRGAIYTNDFEPGGVGAFEIIDGAAVVLEGGPLSEPANNAQLFLGTAPNETGLGLISGAGSSLSLVGSGTGVFMIAGTEGSVGRLTLEDGASLSASDFGALGPDSGVGLSLGESNGVGTLAMDSATLSLESDESIRLFVGREGRGIGIAEVLGGSAVTVRSTAAREDINAQIVLGRSNGDPSNDEGGGDGRMTVSDSTVSVIAPDGGAGIAVGRDFDSQGAMTITGSATSIVVEGGSRGDLIVGQNAGSVGALTMEEGADVALTGAQRGRFEVGRRGSATATLTSGATMRIGEAGSVRAELIVGGETGGVGALTLEGGAAIAMTGEEARLWVGLNEGATGSMVVRDGARVDLGGPDGDVRVGAAFAGFDFPAGGTGSLTVIGEDSAVTASGGVVVGAPVALAGGGRGLGRLTVADGGALTAQSIVIGKGGLLDGAGGLITGDLILDGGVVAPGASPGTLFVDGDFSVLDGLLEIEIGGIGVDDFDLIDISGDFIGRSEDGMLSPFDIRFSFLDGFLLNPGDSFEFLRVGGDGGDLEDLLAMSLIGVEIVGSDARGLELAFDGTSLSASAGPEVAPIPLPASGLMLLAATVALGSFRGRLGIRAPQVDCYQRRCAELGPLS
jgi:fibronectin-binding autotransporter adhesin